MQLLDRHISAFMGCMTSPKPTASCRPGVGCAGHSCRRQRDSRQARLPRLWPMPCFSSPATSTTASRRAGNAPRRCMPSTGPPLIGVGHCFPGASFSAARVQANSNPCWTCWRHSEPCWGDRRAGPRPQPAGRTAAGKWCLLLARPRLVDFACLYIFPQACPFFITCAKKNLPFYRPAWHPVDGSREPQCDQTVLPIISPWRSNRSSRNAQHCWRVPFHALAKVSRLSKLLLGVLVDTSKSHPPLEVSIESEGSFHER